MRVDGYQIGERLAVGANVVVRATRSADGRPVILKLPAAGVDPARAAARLRHELDIAQGLDPSAVVRPLGLVPFADGAALVLDDQGGVALSQRMDAPLSMRAFVTLAIALTGALETVHEAGVVHRDIKPSNAVVLPDGSVRWTDFGVAMRGAGRVESVALVGTLAYMAPEQTGRMHRPVDARADLYSLGVTLYELLAGTTPFRSDDPMVLVHAHIALPPPPLTALRADLPQVLVDIVARLLRKAPEQRYQTAHGLLADLVTLDAAVARGGPFDFPLGGHDLPRTFRLPTGLVGREGAQAALGEAWSEAAGGKAVAVTLFGDAGVGKSALISELLPAVAGDRGWAIRGSCEEAGGELPWPPLLRALGEQLARLLLSTEAELDGHRAHLLDAVGPSARVLADAIPELELVTGPLPAVPELRPAETEVRFTAALGRLVQALAAKHPVLVVMDDVQWAHPTLVDFLVDLPLSSHGGHLMLVLAWRGLGDAAGARARLRGRGAQGPDIALGPLSAEAVTAWLAAGLRQPVDEVVEVGVLVHRRSGGNPYFVEQLVRRLAADGAVQRAGPGWRIDRAAVVALDMAEEVAERLRSELADLPGPTRDTLGVASCIGARFSVGLLADTLGQGRDEVVAALEPAVAAGLLARLEEDWRFADGPEASLRFAHARLWKAASTAVPEPERAARHLAVARCLRTREDAGDAGLLEVVGHVHKGLAAVPDEERLEAAGWFAAGARRALEAVANHAAVDYARAGRELLGPDPWGRDPGLARRLTLALAEACFLTGASDTMERALDELLEHLDDPDQLVDVHELRLHAYSHRARHHEALEACAAGLALLGQAIPRSVSTARGGLELVVRAMRMRRFEPADLAALPPLEDPRLIRALNLMLFAGPSAQAVSPGHLALLMARSLRVISEHGVPPEGPHAYFNFGFVLSAVFRQHDRGQRFAEEALRLLGPPELSPIGGQLTQLFYNYLRPWKEPRHEWVDDYLVAADASLQQGDLEYYGYGLAVWCFIAPLCRFELGWLQSQVLLRARDVARTGQMRMHVVLAALRDELTRITGIQDEGPEPDSLLIGVSDEELATYEADDFVRYSIAGTRVFYLALWGEFDELIALTRSVWSVDSAALGAQSATGLLLRTMTCLAAARRARSAPQEARALRRWVRPMRREVRTAAAESPASFALLERFVTAAWSGLDGDVPAALRAAQEAVDLARGDQLPGFESLAALCAAQEHDFAGLGSSARAWRRVAHAALTRWGAGALAGQLAELDPSLLRRPGAQGSVLGALGTEGTGSLGSISDTGTVDGRGDGALDLGSLLKAGQVISREIVLDRLLDRLLSVAMENAGATRAVIVLVDGTGARVAASSDGLAVGDPLEASEAVPAGVVWYALRTGKDVVLGDARAASLFASDPWIARRGPRSVMVVPLVHQAQATAALYLENDLVSGAFTEARVHLMRSIATQASIAVANARLYADQVSLAQAHGRFVPHQFLRSLDRQDIRQVALGDHVQRDMTVMFSDLRGFTGLSERLGPQRTLEVLNRYLDAMDPSIHDCGGFVDKYIGDAILALFEHGPDGAMAAAVGMSRALRELNRDAPEALRMGIGINTGPLTLGTIGARNRLSCTVVGDSVNLAARLEGLAKTFGSQVLVSEYVRAGLADPDGLHLRLAGRVGIKGREQPVDVLELVDAEPDGVRERRATTRATYDAAVRAFFARDFAGCSEGMREVLGEDPTDPLAARFLARAAALREDPPPEDWTGLEQQLHK